MIETINGKAYLKVGDKVYELGGGSNIITADSVEQLPDPASVPEGTIALVKSEGGGGLPVVELETVPTTEGVAMSASDNAKLSAIVGKPAILNIMGVMVFVFNYVNEDGAHMFVSDCMGGSYMFMCTDGETWTGHIITRG